MEILGDDGSCFEIKCHGSEAVFGRGLGFNTKDRTVSRRHVLFQICKTDSQTEPRVSFQVIGKNPIWVKSEGAIRVFRQSQKGEVAPDDWFCVSSQCPVWFAVKKIEDVKEEERDLEESGASVIDPVKEFGFVVIGHEFDCYPKQRIKNPKNWEWFLEETKEDNTDDSDFDDKKKRIGSGKRKRNKRRGDDGDGDDDDDDWSGEREEDKEAIARTRKFEKSKMATRSKDKFKMSSNDAGRRKKKIMAVDEDETLGGFIVDDNDDEQASESDDEEEEEEEEFIEDEDEELDD